MPEAKGSDFPTKPPENIPGRTPKRPNFAEILQKRAAEILSNLGHKDPDSDTVQAHAEKLFDEHVESGHIGVPGLGDPAIFDPDAPTEADIHASNLARLLGRVHHPHGEKVSPQDEASEEKPTK